MMVKMIVIVIMIMIMIMIVIVITTMIIIFLDVAAEAAAAAASVVVRVVPDEPKSQGSAFTTPPIPRLSFMTTFNMQDGGSPHAQKPVHIPGILSSVSAPCILFLHASHTRTSVRGA